MADSIGRRFDALLDHYVAACLFLAAFVLAFGGVGDLKTVSAVGLLLCAIGMVQCPKTADLWGLLPLLLWNGFSMLSSFRAYGNVIDGYASTQMLYPVMYLLLSCVSADDRRLLRKLCAGWGVAAAAAGIAGFVYQAIRVGTPPRLGGILGNPNAMGIFLVVAWFLLLDCGSPLLRRFEPVLLAALALTLSMGSFLSMAAGIFVLFVLRAREASLRGALPYLFSLLAKAALGVGTGILLYLAAARTLMPAVCLLLVLYLAALVALWDVFDRFLAAFPKRAAVIAACGVLVALAAALVRPSAAATFIERFEMMGSGLCYLFQSPLTGVGPYKWRLLDLSDGGKYFNTWHIHNQWIHVGVELGLPALLCLAFAAARFFRRPKTDLQRAGFLAFFVHNLMDTSFFYMGITTLALFAGADPEGKPLSPVLARLLFLLPAMLFACGLFTSLRG